VSASEKRNTHKILMQRKNKLKRLEKDERSNVAASK
jgi:hypothetical protein